MGLRPLQAQLDRKLPFQRKPSFQLARDAHGQAALMVALISTTFFLFIAFVLNIGMLVNAKINLQNAADMAAYAGAAAQARHLNHIAFLNYEMRRELKKYAFRQTVVGTLAYPDAPGGAAAAGSGKRTYAQNGANSLDRPVTCLIFLPEDNVCQNAELRGFKIPTPNPLDALQSTFVSTIQTFEAARQENCLLASTLNRTAVTMWLFNTDPNLRNISQQLESQSGNPAVFARKAMQTIQAVANGLGIYPKEFLLRSRIRTLQDYVNAPPRTSVKPDDIDPLRQGVDPMMNERVILAFQSAYKSLGEGTFDNEESITLDELLPVSGDGNANLLQLDPIEITFDSFHSEFKLGADTNGSRPCEREIVPTNANLPLPVGFKKRLDSLVYYAVRLSADAKLLFNPFGNSIRLTAYAAAQPFGSRIGPPRITESEFTVPDDPASLAGITSNDPCASGNCARKRIQMTLAPNIDFDSYELQDALAGLARDGTSITYSGILKAQAAIMSPSLSEVGRYTIPNDVAAAEQFQKYFDEPAAVINNVGTYAFWAPVVAPMKLATSSPEQVLQQIFAGGASTTQTSNPGGTVTPGGQLVTEAFIEAFKANIGLYIAALRQGMGENGEGWNIARITNPIPENGRLPASIAASSIAQLRTSWNKPRDPDMHPTGRVGYSVKFVPLKMLQHRESGAGTQPTTDNSGTSWSNDLPEIDSEMENDLQAIEH
jgi:hypothetical protein